MAKTHGKIGFGWLLISHFQYFFSEIKNEKIRTNIQLFYTIKKFKNNKYYQFTLPQPTVNLKSIRDKLTI